MISLTRLQGARFALNPDLIERVEATPDTVVTLVTGSRYVVAESLEQVVAAVLQQRAEILARAGHLAATAAGARSAATASESPDGATVPSPAGSGAEPRLRLLAPAEPPVPPKGAAR
ncbi:flagellar FlbD family protein [Aciditerrimonas ferrireducens]|jgi:flagellar protein FlbD|uniref:Flagellar FlbD family protein n=1 Tax=Aciditerrimonas ferrireducens TaxID=667306 RepID=A0ABV6C1L0_9ACTN